MEAPSPTGKGSGSGSEEWSCVTSKRAKAKKNKKAKNVRTLSLQTFISETGGELSPPSSPVDTELVKESLLVYFSDLVLRSGPLRLDGPQLKAHVGGCLADESLSEAHHLLQPENLPVFLSMSPDLMVVDDYVCSSSQSAQAKQLALRRVLESVESFTSSVNGSSGSSSGSSTRTCSAVGFGAPGGNVWNSGPPKSTSPSSNNGLEVDPLLQLPRVESLFNGTKPSGGSGGVPFVSTRLPDLSTPPPTLRVAGESAYTVVERMNKRLQGLALSNSDLLRQLAEKDRQLDRLRDKVEGQERQLELAKLEVARLQRLSPLSSVSSAEGAAAGSADSLLVGALKKQLEGERWNSNNLKEQLEMERVYANRMAEKHNLLLNQLQNLTDLSKRATTATGCDSFGLRGLIANATTSSPEDSLFPSHSSGSGLDDHDLFGLPKF